MGLGRAPTAVKGASAASGGANPGRRGRPAHHRPGGKGAALEVEASVIPIRVDAQCRVHAGSRPRPRKRERRQAECWSMPTMVLSETRGLMLYGVMRGGLACGGGWRRRRRLCSKRRLTLKPETSPDPTNHDSVEPRPLGFTSGEARQLGSVSIVPRRRLLLSSTASTPRWRFCAPP